MPAIITHDAFGKDVYDQRYEFIGGSRDEAEAFLLGNQGPDPLFYAVTVPRLWRHFRLGSTMHGRRPSELLVALRRGVGAMGGADKHVARAYALGFLCHYELDSTAHPFIYAQQYKLCDAGVEDLSREDGSEVHALVESELDELVLTAKHHATISTFNPAACILHAPDRVLGVVSALYVYVAREVYDIQIPPDMFKASVKAHRRVQAAFYSPSGFKHNVLGRVEELARPYSFYRAMSHRNLLVETSPFDNRQHAQWENPYTGAASTDGFWDLFEHAKQKALCDMPAFDSPSFDREAAHSITHGLNFSGKPDVAQTAAAEDAKS